MQLPLAHLFTGTDQARVQDITSALYIGPARVGDILTDHYAFRQEGVDWQILDRAGQDAAAEKARDHDHGRGGPAPIRVVMKWNLSPSLSDKTFTFVPPKDAHKIVFVGQATGATK